VPSLRLLRWDAHNFNQEKGEVITASISKDILRRAAKIARKSGKADEMVTVAVDAAGGDKGMLVNIEAAYRAIKRVPKLKIVLVGHQAKIREHLTQLHVPSDRVEIVHAEKTVEMGSSAIEAARDSETSIAKGVELIKQHQADAFISVGHTGAVAASAVLRLGMLSGIERPGILALFPTMGGHQIAVIDVGATTDCKPHNLVQFAVIGSEYVKHLLGYENPKIGLLSIGEEPSKGNAVVKKAHAILKESAEKLGINFVGNIEGRDILSGNVDVLVCDGFVGNILLKYTESIYSIVKQLMHKGRRISILSLIGFAFLYPAIRRTLRNYNYAEYGGAPLLGVDGNIIVGHGLSSSKAIQNAIIMAYEMALVNLPLELRKAAKKLEVLNIEVKNSRHRVKVT